MRLCAPPCIQRRAGELSKVHFSACADRFIFPRSNSRPAPLVRTATNATDAWIGSQMRVATMSFSQAILRVPTGGARSASSNAALIVAEILALIFHTGIGPEARQLR